MQVTRGPLERLGFPLQKEKWGILELAVYSYVSFPFFMSIILMSYAFFCLQVYYLGRLKGSVRDLRYTGAAFHGCMNSVLNTAPAPKKPGITRGHSETKFWFCRFILQTGRGTQCKHNVCTSEREPPALIFPAVIHLCYRARFLTCS